MSPTSRRRSTGGITLGGLIVVIIIAAIMYFFPSIGGTATPTVIPTPPMITAPSGQSDWLQVYFTNPNPPDDTANGIDRYVVADINAAQTSIDVASFDLNLPSFVDALVAADQRGVKVRVVVDGVNGSQVLDASKSPTGEDYDATKLLTKAGIKVVNGGRSSGLMHDKMIIIDGKILYVGSWNMSFNDTFRNNNNLLRITEPTLIANYQAKFNELDVDQNFGTHAEVGAQTPQMNIGGIQVENYFSPVDMVMDKLIAYVQGAQTSVRFIIFTYTDVNLANAMIARSQAGVDVEGVIENRGASQGAMVPLFCAKLPVKVDGNSYTMHHKVIVIDGKIVITGSYNFTKSADNENDDNIIVIHDPSLAQLYLQEFDRVWSLAKTPDSVTCK